MPENGDSHQITVAVVLKSLNPDSYEDIHIDRDPYIIGRSNGCQTRLKDGFVSQLHLRIKSSRVDSAQASPDAVAFVDDLSLNGTYVNNVRIEKDKEIAVKGGDTISLVRAFADSSSQCSCFAYRVERYGPHQLVLESLNPIRPSIEIEREPFDVGSARTCQVHIDDDRIKSFISSTHFRIFFSRKADVKADSDCLAIVEDRSTNGTFVNSKKVGKGSKQPLKDGDILSLVVSPQEEDDGKWTSKDTQFDGLFFAYRVSSRPLSDKDLAQRRTVAAATATTAAAAAPGHAPAAALAAAASGSDAPDGGIATQRRDTADNLVDDAAAGAGAAKGKEAAGDAVVKKSDVELVDEWYQQRENDQTQLKYNEDIDEQQVLGEGGYAKVYAGIHRATGVAVAIKVIDQQQWKKDKGGLRDDQLMEEFKIQRELKHRNIVRTLGMYDKPRRYLRIILEKAAGGDLFELLASKGRGLEEVGARDMFRQLLDAVAYLHDRNIVHRDLKPENILLDSKDTLVPKIADFGLAKSKNGQVTYGKESDLWGMGTILFVMLSLSLPFGNSGQNLQSKAARTSVDLSGHSWRRISEPGKELIRALLTVDTTKRLTAHQALQHPWVSPGGPKRPAPDAAAAAAAAAAPPQDVTSPDNKRRKGGLLST